MKKSAKVVLLASLLSVGLFQSIASAVTVTKKYWYDWNTMWEYSTNYHNHQYISSPLWSILSIKLAEDGITIVMRS